jgi:CxxC motif-containing protein (DUF1111 family)
MAVLIVSTTIIAGCSSPAADLLAPGSGGDTTTALADRDAFSTAAANLDTVERRRFEDANALFTGSWVAIASPTDPRGGLGPLMNAASCSSCHVLDGRAAPPDGSEYPRPGLTLRIGVVREGIVSDHPTYGAQIQDRAIDGIDAEATVLVEYHEVPGSYADGTPYSLRSPTYQLVDLAYGDPGPLLMSPRVAPAVIGMGLLEAIPVSAILARADPEDRDGDGISGRANSVHSTEHDRQMLARFGWKADVPTITDQVAQAFAHDIGITSNLIDEDACTANQVACREAQTASTPELSSERLDDVAFYVTTIAVPQRRNLGDDAVRRGADLFGRLGCTSCHIPTFTTGAHAVGAVAGQVIHPFTDLLLHDMGPGLADSTRGGVAGASEWRTPPLWGLGLIATVNGHTELLHDGRARSIDEAILWHGGEAEAARNAFTTLDAEDRARVIAFLESL